MSTKKNSEKKSLLTEIQKSASWKDEKKLQNLKETFLSKYPDEREEMEKKIQLGELLSEIWDDAYKLGRNGKPVSAIQPLEGELRQKGMEDFLIEKVRTQYDKGVQARQRANETRKNSSKNTPPKVQAEPMELSLSLNNPSSRELNMKEIHPNFLSNLKAAKSWTILVDETGSCFNDGIFTKNLKEMVKGKCVALLVPEGIELPALPDRWHAVEAKQSEIEKNVETLLATNCGILGITAESLNPIHCDLWFSCLENLLDLVVRFLPLDGDTELRLFVEQRGNANPRNNILLEKTCEDVLYRLSRVFPERAEKISFKERFIRKEEHSWNGYVDTAAFLWGSPTQKNLLRSTGWLNTCFLGTDPKKLRNAQDVLGRCMPLTAVDWSTLVLSADATCACSVTSALLKLLGEEAQRNPEVWNTYLNHVQYHFDSKAICLPELARQIEWLKRFQPEECVLVPRLQLIWLTVQLANDNHLGRTDSFKKSQLEFGKLCRQIYYEDAPLVCLAMLHISVALMNEFDFRRAADAVRKWNEKPVEVMGRLYYGRLLSTYGQLMAFIAKNEEAIPWFREALKHFQKLSDQRMGALESTQTRAYLLIAMMDCPETSEAELNRELGIYFGMKIDAAIDTLSVSDAPAEKYAHHVLLRYLVSRGTEAQKQRYISRSSGWKKGFGHPWELICFYRALLTEDATRRQTLLRQAADLAIEGGDMTLKVIACVILGGLYHENQACENELRTLTEEVITHLPALGKNRVKALERQLETPIPALELAKIILPFNFR